MARHLRGQTLSNLPTNLEGQLGRCRQFVGGEKSLSLFPNSLMAEPARITNLERIGTILFILD
jgi:hypothetical protein